MMPDAQTLNRDIHRLYEGMLKFYYQDTVRRSLQIPFFISVGAPKKPCWSKRARRTAINLRYKLASWIAGFDVTEVGD